MTTEQRVKEIISDRLGTPADEIKPEHSIEEDLGADSLDAVDLIMEIEKEFNISIPDEDAESLKTVQQITSYVVDRCSLNKRVID